MAKHYSDYATIPVERRQHCVLLYSLHLSTKKAAMPGKPNVKPMQAGLAGHYDRVTGKLVCPDIVACVDALPWYYRGAFTRAHGRFSFCDMPGATKLESAYLTLRGTRGRILNTLYAIPYYFDSEVDLTPEFIAARQLLESLRTL